MSAWSWPATAPTPDARRALRVFNVSPNWKGGLLERLSWLTDVMSSETAVEQRRTIRRYPRRSFEGGFLRTDNTRARLDSFLVGTGREQFMVPLWHEQFKLGEPSVDNSVTFPQGSLAKREFRLNDLVLVSAGDVLDYDVLTVVSVNLATDTITLAAAGPIGNWTAGSRITPLRRARIIDAIQMTNPSDRVGNVQIRFEHSDADPNFVPSWGYCAPLWRFKPDRRAGIEFNYARSDFVLDLQSGVVESVDPGGRAQVSATMRLKLYGRDKVAEFRSFLYAARGRAVRFYVPTFMADIHPTTDITGDTFDAMPNGFSDYMTEPQEARRIIGIVFNDGRPTVYRTIIGVAPVLSGVSPFRQVAERFVVDQMLPPILKQDIERIMFVVPARFDQDSMELHHATDDSAAVATSLVVRSSVVAGMPPIECWVTSKPYPAQMEDPATSSAALLGGYFYDPRIFDNVTSAAVVTAGAFSGGVLSTIVEPDAAVASALLTAGAFSGGVQSATAPTDLTISSFSFIAGTLNTILIAYDRYDFESTTSSAILIEGTLT